MYQPPVLEHLGDVRMLTLGGSPGAGDSGADDLVEKVIGL
jgi:hypothetical protein